MRDVPEDVHATLRSRAAADGISVSAYVLRMLQDEASMPSAAEVFARRRDAVTLTNDDIVAAIHDGRR